MTDEAAPVTTGHTISWARYYDVVVAIMTLGRARGIWRETVALAEIAAGEAVLDAGCGTGNVAVLASRRVGPAGRVSGIDAAPEMIAVARRKAARARLGIDFRVAAIEALPFAASTFDVVVNSLVMHHLPDDLKRRALTELRRVLKPGGRLVIVDFKRPAGHRAHFTLPFLFHRHLHSGVQDLRSLCTEAGFIAVEAGETRFGFLGFLKGRVRE